MPTFLLVLFFGCQQSAVQPSQDQESVTQPAPQNGGSGGGGQQPQALTETQKLGEEVIFKDLKEGGDQLQLLCSRGGQDKVRRVFCTSNPPVIDSLKSLQNALGLAPVAQGIGVGGIAGQFLGGGAGFVFTGASSSLVKRFTNSINPRLIMFNGVGANAVAMGFVRGEQFVELLAADQTGLKFFLVKFEQDCNKREGGCNFGDLLTGEIEKNWRKVTIYEDSDIENTIFDCNQCHQPDGPRTRKIMRMQELQNPWTHFMRSSGAGANLLADMTAVHHFDANNPESQYAGVPSNRFGLGDPARLEGFIRANGFGNQPNEFPSGQIQGEAALGRKDTWSRLYERSVRGDVIPPPYHQLRNSDVQKLRSMAQAYIDVRNGQKPPSSLPDIRETFPDNALRDLSFMVKDNLDPKGILVHACAQCHNSKLNQQISRAKFNVDLSKMNTEAKQKAIDRIFLPDNDPKKMPPARFKRLTDKEKNDLKGLLSQ